MKLNTLIWAALAISSIPLHPTAHAADYSNKLLLTGGVSQVEGAAGGGLTPWALIGGYGTNNEIGGNVHHAGPAALTVLRLAPASGDPHRAAEGCGMMKKIFHRKGAKERKGPRRKAGTAFNPKAFAALCASFAPSRWSARRASPVRTQ